MREVLDSELQALPVFPLVGVVLFPGALLPLHVFEPRYRKMLADCLAANGPMAMAFQAGDHDDPDRPPPFESVAGAGFVVQNALLADGRSNIVLQGRVRVALEELPFVAPYRRARARILDDIATPVPAIDRTGLYATAAALASAARLRDFDLPAGLDPGRAADLCAHRLIGDALARQRVLEELDVRERVRLVTADLAEQLGRVQHGSREARDKAD